MKKFVITDIDQTIERMRYAALIDVQRIQTKAMCDMSYACATSANAQQCQLKVGSIKFNAEKQVEDRMKVLETQINALQACVPSEE